LQIIDRDEVTIPAGKDSFRLLASLKVGAGTTYLSREKSVLTGKVIGSGGGRAEKGWKNGELHLFDLFLHEKDQLASYCFVLVQAKDWTK
jgi:hypothetical protein